MLINKEFQVAGAALIISTFIELSGTYISAGPMEADRKWRGIAHPKRHCT